MAKESLGAAVLMTPFLSIKIEMGETYEAHGYYDRM